MKSPTGGTFYVEFSEETFNSWVFKELPENIQAEVSFRMEVPESIPVDVIKTAGMNIAKRKIEKVARRQEAEGKIIVVGSAK